jgi:hypothetical protein
LVLAHGRAPEHRRLGLRVKPDELAASLQAPEQVAGVLGLGRCLKVKRDTFDQPRQQRERLLECPVQELGVSRPDPPDRVGRDAGLQ